MPSDPGAFVTAVYADADGRMVFGTGRDGVRYLVRPNDARLTGVMVGAYQAPPEPVKLARTYKADIWRRATETEVQQLDAALDEAPARLRRLFNDSQVIMQEAEEFPALRASVAAIVGDERADVLLAPSFYGG